MSSHHFQLQEATIDSIHHALRAGEITCRQLVEMYLARIEAYDKNGPEINSIITLNSKAIEEAEELDRVFRETGKFVGPLHGIPVVVKDQIETKDMPTTYGSIAFKSYVPKDDATVVKKLRQAGGIILAKTSLPDFASSWFGFSSVSGETKNPYVLERDPGASSAGTGAAIAANFAAVGIGEDTGGSIRVPTSFNNLFGVRVTTGLISRNGTSPLVHFQDTVGPMTRTVKDAAILLDALVGYDPTDPFTSAAMQATDAGTYTDQLAPNALKGSRIGILRDAFGSDTDPDSSQVNKKVNQAIERIKNAGAEVVDPITIPNLADFIEITSMYLVQSKRDINRFLAEKTDAPVTTIEELYRTNQYHEQLDLFKEIAAGPTDPEQDPNYYKKLSAQEKFRRAVLNVMANHRLDAILFPDVQVLPPKKKDLYAGKWTVLTFPTNTLIASQTGLPAISMPAGFTDDGVPVGVEIIGKLYDEATLLKLAYSYEYFTRPRKAPEIVPPLENES